MPLRLVLVILIATAGVCVVLLPSTSLAGAGGAYMTPNAMATKIHGLVPQIPTDNRSAPSVITSTTCSGLGTSRMSSKGRTFNRFRCRASWARGTSHVWARALPGGKFCASSTGLASCPAGAPTKGDPRICRNPPAPPTGDPNRCALAATENALIRAMKINFADPSWTIGNVSCKGTNLSRKCTFMKLNTYGIHYSSTIKMARAHGVWTATIVTKGGGTSSCLVQPAPKTRAGKPSNWAAGPDPTCALITSARHRNGTTS